MVTLCPIKIWSPGHFVLKKCVTLGQKVIVCSLLGMRFCDLFTGVKLDEAVSASVKKQHLVYLHGVTQQHFAH